METNDKVNEADLAYAAEVPRRDAALDIWRDGRCSYHPSELPDYIDAPTNDERSACEVIEFLANPLPLAQTYTAYMSADCKRVTTFTGETLAHSVRPTGPRGFRAIGIDGRDYHGRYNGPGMWLRLRLSHVQSKPR